MLMVLSGMLQYVPDFMCLGVAISLRFLYFVCVTSDISSLFYFIPKSGFT